jgi:hypothetical protein
MQDYRRLQPEAQQESTMWIRLSFELLLPLIAEESLGEYHERNDATTADYRE